MVKIVVVAQIAEQQFDMGKDRFGHRGALEAAAMATSLMLDEFGRRTLMDGKNGGNT